MTALGAEFGSFSNIGYGVFMCLISFSIVFLVCGGLMLLILAQKYLVAMFEAKDGVSPGGPKNFSEPGESAKTNRVSASAEEDEELAAVITAAIAASQSSNVKIVSISPSDQIAARTLAPSLWKMSGRLQSHEGL
jgi:Na+-transporting methylmalonyl-CoA/oxaloacetate decarboxylase gamma subunit